MRPTSGEFNRRITIQQATETRGASGQPEVSYSNFYECWACFASETGREVEAAVRINPEAGVVVKIRHRAGITPKMRIIYGSRKFDILHIEDIGERRETLRLTCKEGLSQGS